MLLKMAGVYLKSLPKPDFKKFIDSFDVVLSDCDGVLWEENNVIKGSPETVVKFKELGKKFFYITNNNSKTRDELDEKCKKLNYDTNVEEILCTSYLAAMYLKEKNFNKKVYLIGSEAIATELKAQGIQSFGIGPDPMEGDELDVITKFTPDPEVGAIVVGFDKYFSYPKLIKSSTYANNPDIHFIGTNPDLERPSPNSNRFPGAGCFLKSIEAGAGRNATILGKPEPYVSEFIIRKYGINPARTLMIGDNLNTDIQLGKRCGFTTLLVLSGITSLERFEKTRTAENAIVPDFYADRIADVIEYLQSP